MTRTTPAPRAAAAATARCRPFEAVPVQSHGRLIQGEDGGLPGQDRGQGEQPLLRRPAARPGASGLHRRARRRPAPRAPSRPRLPPASRRSPKPTSRSTVRSKSWSRGCWNSSPTVQATRPVGMPAMLVPATRTSPVCGCSRPLKWRSSVDLPAPLGPVTSDDLPRPHGQVQVAQHGAGRAVPAEPAWSCGGSVAKADAPQFQDRGGGRLPGRAAFPATRQPMPSATIAGVAESGARPPPRPAGLQPSPCRRPGRSSARRCGPGRRPLWLRSTTAVPASSSPSTRFRS